jgi:hypothetical protein
MHDVFCPGLCVCVYVCVCVCVCIINFTITIFLSLFLFLHFPSFSCAIIHCSPAQVIFLSLLIYSVILSSLPHLSPQPVTTLHVPPTHSSPADQPTVPTVHNPRPCNPWHKHPPLQQQKYTPIHKRATKPSSPHILSPTHPPLFLTSLSVHSTNFPNFWI